MGRWARKKPKVLIAGAVMLLLACFAAGTLLQLRVANQQREKAQAAERQAKQLQAQSHADAGVLAMQRGRMQQALEHFASSEVLTPLGDTYLWPKLEALIATRRIEEANDLVQQLPATVEDRNPTSL